jgi:ornithine cyclodeaminase
MARCLEAVEEAMRAASAGQVVAPDRLIAPLPDGVSYFILMPGSLEQPPVYGAKIVGLHPGNSAAGRQAVQGFVALFDGHDGGLLALIDGAELTRLRTAAASALATRELARSDACTHGLFGAGVQAAAHLEAIALVRRIEHTVVWARDPGKAREFALEQGQRTGWRITATEDPAEAGACDVVTAVTNSPTPVLRGAWLRPGAHLNLVGAHEPEHREADSEAVCGAAVYVDSRQSALNEAGDLLIPIAEGGMSADDIVGELGEVLTGEAAGRRDARQITLYKSLGIVAQDLFAAVRVLQAARDQDVGRTVEFP